MTASAELTTDETGSGPFEPTWESLRQYRCPDWFRDAKLGIYTHWGVYAVPALQTEWYSHFMYQPDHPIHAHHVATYGHPSRFGYKDFVPQFTAARFDPDEWAELFVRAGARFAGPVAEHADGFAMWATALNEWNAGTRGPGRDVVGQLEAAVRQHGLKFATSLHHHWLWGWYASADETADSMTGQHAGLYGPPLPLTAFSHDPDPRPDGAFCRQWLAKTREVVDRYHPDLIYFDNRMAILPERYRLEMASHYYNQSHAHGTAPVLTYKSQDMQPGTATLDFERGRAADILPDPWLTDTSLARNSWGYTDDLEYYSTSRLVHDLMDIVSKNGCVMLNVAPRADGTIPDEQKTILVELGDWLRTNGEAVYGTRPWKVFGEGPTQITAGNHNDLKLEGFTPEDVRFTVRPGADPDGDGDTLYATVLGVPAGPVTITALGRQRHPEPVEAVSLLGCPEPVAWQHTAPALIIHPPRDARAEHAAVFEVAFRGSRILRSPRGG